MSAKSKQKYLYYRRLFGTMNPILHKRSHPPSKLVQEAPQSFYASNIHSCFICLFFNRNSYRFGQMLSRLRASAAVPVFVTTLTLGNKHTVFTLKSVTWTNLAERQAEVKPRGQSSPGKQAGALKTDGTGGSRISLPAWPAGPERSKPKGWPEGGARRRRAPPTFGERKHN